MRPRTQIKHLPQSLGPILAPYSIVETIVENLVTQKDIEVGGIPVTVYKARYSQFIKLEKLWKKFINNKDTDPVLAFKKLVEFLVEGGIPKEVVDAADLYDLAEAASALSNINAPAILPMFMKDPKDPKVKEDTKKSREHKKNPWEYEGYELTFYFGLLSKHYSWTIDEISNLYPEDVFMMTQECLLDEQFEKEWNYNYLSKNGYHYDKKGSITHRDSYPRPWWMRDYEMPKSTKIRKDTLPAGYVVDIEGNE